jgi:hypothetical protein
VHEPGSIQLGEIIGELGYILRAAERRSTGLMEELGG